MKNYGMIALIVALLALSVGVYAVYNSYSRSRVAYIELQTVFNDFDMTKQYKGKLEAVVNARKAIADSLELSLTAQSKVLKRAAKQNDAEVESFLYDKEFYMQKMKQFQEDNMAMKQQYDAEINKQLNQYVKEYGQKHGYRFIYGAEGSGVIMYANESYNVSTDVIEYINKRYKGEPK